MFYDHMGSMVAELAHGLKPGEKLSVSQVAKKYRFLNNPGSYVGPWMHEKVPYMVKPMDSLSGGEHTGMIFVGPAQAAKTELALNFLAYSAKCDPSDMMILAPSQKAARDFNLIRLEKMLRDSPAIGDLVRKGAANKNVFDTRFKSGMINFLSWPTVNELSGKPIRRLWLADYDRMDEDVGEEGSPYDLAAKRTTSFKRFGMCVAESSPSRALTTHKWLPSSIHEAPPTTGILELYNRGDRQRWYWPCYQCKEIFEPDFSRVVYVDSEDIQERVESAVIACPHCGAPIGDEPTKNAPGKYETNINGVWVPDGMSWNGTKLIGNPRRTKITSFWLKGPAAAFTSIKSLVEKYLVALNTYEKTGDQEPLKSTVNTDQGLPFVPFNLEGTLLPENLKKRASAISRGVVPDGVRYLLAAVDVQRSRFAVQVMGFHANNDISFIDRFDIKHSLRKDAAGHNYPITPGAYPEDWKHLIDEVMLKQYPLASDPKKVMHVKATACDSGGDAGVTKNAYAFWLKLRDSKTQSGLHKRFHLVKGASNQEAPLLVVSYPNSDRKDRNAGARGEVPVLRLNSNRVKDAVHKMLERDDEGGRVNFPEWFENNMYEELTQEVRTLKGWENPKKKRNETWDLLCYGNALNWSQYIRGDKIKWETPPSWAEEVEKNSLVADIGSASFSLAPAKKFNFAELGKSLA
jgi:phage terminase large subunit GpA-like protein